MATRASGKYAQAISDRSGQAFPYREMVKEWTGALVHRSEFEPKHPQLVGVANLTLPGDFAFSSNGMQPDDGSAQNRGRQAISNIGQVTIGIT